MTPEAVAFLLHELAEDCSPNVAREFVRSMLLETYKPRPESARQPKVLVVDDQESIRQMLQSLLHASDCEAVLASGSAEACVALEDSGPGVRSALGAGMSVLVFAGFGEDPSAVERAHGVVRNFVIESPTSIDAMHRAAMGANE